MNKKHLLFVLLVAVIVFCLSTNPDTFANTSFLGYQQSDNFKLNNSFPIFNRPDTIDWNLFALNAKFQFQSVLPFYPKGSVLPFPSGKINAPKTTPVLMIPGMGDCVLLHGSKKVWPPTTMEDLEDLQHKSLTLHFDQNNSNLTPLINTLKSLKYNSETISIQPYDFRHIAEKTNITELFKRIHDNIIRLFEYSNLRVLLVGHGLGAVLLNLFLLRQDQTFVKTYVKELVCVDSVFGGTTQALNDYVNGIPEFGKKRYIVQRFDSVKLSIPNSIVYGDSVVISKDNAMYNSSELNNLFKYLHIPIIDTDIRNLQKESLSPVKQLDVSLINNKSTNNHLTQLIDYWNKELNLTVLEEDDDGDKLFNNYNVILSIIKKLKI
jgi:hypothetical protein